MDFFFQKQAKRMYVRDNESKRKGEQKWLNDH